MYRIKHRRAVLIVNLNFYATHQQLFFVQPKMPNLDQSLVIRKRLFYVSYCTQNKPVVKKVMQSNDISKSQEKYFTYNIS